MIKINKLINKISKANNIYKNKKMSNISNISFNVGEVIWAKIRGYPWWPAIITGTDDDIREKKYAVSFIKDNTHASLAKKCLEKFDEEGEMGYDKLNELIYTILKVVDCDIDILGVYDFFNLFLFDLNKKLKMIAKENGFIDFFNQSVNIFAIKIEQDISLSNIVPSAKSLGIIMFSLEYAKFMVNKNLQNDNVNFLVENWIKKVKNILINHKPEDVKRVIHWLNDYVNTH